MLPLHLNVGGAVLFGESQLTAAFFGLLQRGKLPGAACAGAAGSQCRVSGIETSGAAVLAANSSKTLLTCLQRKHGLIKKNSLNFRVGVQNSSLNAFRAIFAVEGWRSVVVIVSVCGKQLFNDKNVIFWTLQQLQL